MRKNIKLILFVITSILTISFAFNIVNAENVKETFSSVTYDDFYIKKIRANGTGQYKKIGKIMRNSDNRFVYCVQPWVDLVEGKEYDAHTFNQADILGVTPDIWERISLIAYFGYGYTNHTDERWYGITQLMIWETMDPAGDFYFTKTLNGARDTSYDWMKQEIENLITNNNIMPKFTSNNLTLNIGDTITITDSNSVLNLFDVSSNNDTIRVEKEGNTLKITALKVGESSIVLNKPYNNGLVDKTPILYNRVSAQETMSRGSLDPARQTLAINVIGGTVSLEKFDSQTLSFKPQGDATLKGAVYGIYDEYNARVGELVTTGNSLVTSDYLPRLGKYYILEENSSKGYKLDGTKYFFEITTNNLNPKITVYEDVIEVEFELYKMFAGKNPTAVLTAEPNVTFQFYLKSNMELYETATTDENGRLSVTLPYGTYIVRQATTTPNYEKLQDFEIVIDENSKDKITEIATNDEITTKLRVIKIDKDSQRVLVRDGIKFKIKNLDTNEYVCQNITYPTPTKVCEFQTADGMFVTPDVLSLGNYQIEELEEQEIEGYVWNSEPLKFTISNDSEYVYDDEFGVILEVQFSNKQVKGEFILTKLGEKMVIEDGNFTYEEIEITGIGFELYANGDILSQDGTLIYHDGDLVKKFILDSSEYKISNLYLGKYCLKEVSTLENHVLDPSPYCFELEYKDQYTPIVSIEIILKNYLKKGDFELSKIDFSTGEPVEGSLLEIYTENDELVFRGRSDKEKGIIVKNLSVGRYKYIELEAPEGFILNTEVHYFEIKEDGSIVKDTLSNEMIKGDFKLIKTNSSNGEPVEGALIGVFDEDNNMVFSGYTNSAGEIYVQGLKYGKYSYRELESPEGFILDTEVHYFEIKKHEEVVEVTMTNEEEIIEVPNTSSNSNLVFFPVAMISIGIILLIIDNVRNKRQIKKDLNNKE